MSEQDWSYELRLIRSRGVTFAPGLTSEEFARIEIAHCFRFPPDLRTLLSLALPLSEPGGSRFPDWRTENPFVLADQLAWPFEGIAYDIEHNAFWWKNWGIRPASLDDAIAVAKTAVEKAPKLIPIFGHRYLPSEPCLPGNPIFSAHQTDIIYYGLDLRRYIECEFGAITHAEAVRGEPRLIQFWSDLVDANG
jgi:hypothetical protein